MRAKRTLSVALASLLCIAPAGCAGGGGSGGGASAAASPSNPSTPAATDPCNGHPELCERRYDEVAYVATHNAFNYEGTFLFPNQGMSVGRQLEAGVRALMLDLHYLSSGNKNPYVFHSYSALGFETLRKVLAEVQGFLAQHPREVVTLILETYVDAQDVDRDLTQSGLAPFLHQGQDPSAPWPTLEEMIRSGRRLVVLSDRRDARFAWCHYVWDHAVETDWSAAALADLDTRLRRGSPQNALFILNHFLTDPLIGVGSRQSAALANRRSVLEDRIARLEAATGLRPSFITVDFFDTGDALDVADGVNGVR